MGKIEPVPPASGGVVKHGARSEANVTRVGTVQKRRLLRQMGMRLDDLDGVGRGYLDSWARAQAKVELMDAWQAEHGFIGEDGEPPPWTKVYFAALNSARLSLGKLAEHLKKTGAKDSMVRQMQAQAQGIRRIK